MTTSIITAPQTTDGFTILSAYDSNTDNVIDVNDAQFGDL